MNTYRDGKVYICAEMCPTCLFRPGNLMHLRAGRLRDIIDENVRADSALTCHSTLPETGSANQAICRGFFDRHQTTPLQLAQRLGVIEFQ